MCAEPSIAGTCLSRFERVEEAFQRNFTEGREVGASLAVIWDGELVVDLWGGYADAAQTQAWARDTLTTVFSTTKMVAAMVVLRLADRGLIDLDAPLAAYWPDFGRRGKEKILVRHVLSHTAGLPVFTPRVVFEDLFDWEKIIHLLEAEKPRWKPGSKLGYHTVTYGYLLGEAVRRVTGRTLGQVLREEITAPLGIDFHIGLPEAAEPRVAGVVPMRQPITPLQMALLKLVFPLGMRNMVNPPLDSANFNTPACWKAEIPAGNGIGNARSVAQLGAVLAGGGSYQGKQILSRRMVEQAIQEQARGRDAVAFLRPSSWGLGVVLYNPAFLLGPRSFYTTGMGGSVCVMDLERNIVIAYVMNKMAELAEGDARSVPLVQAMWACLENR